MPLIATRGAASAQGFGEFAQTTAPVYIEDVFSTYLYTGNSSTQTITNNIDLSGKGGLVWIKSRSNALNHALFDTARGTSKWLYTNSTSAAVNSFDQLTSFNSSGFSLGSDGLYTNVNTNNYTYTSWTFREQPKFFDVVTYTGNGTQPRTIAHNLGSVPGCIIIKRTDMISDWAVYHRALDATTPQGYRIELNTTNERVATSTTWNNQAPTSTEFYIGSATYNASGGTYVAYLFAHNAGGFGLTGSDNVISCGSFTTDGSGNATVNLGYEPQWLLVKNNQTASSWYIFDVMRGFSQTSISRLFPNNSNAELTQSGNYYFPTATGFQIASGFENPSETYIYIAIRRGPMKTPTTGTSVFNAITRTGTGAAATITGIGFAPDFVYPMCRNDIANKGGWVDKLRGASANLTTNLTDAESTNTQGVTAFGNTSISVGTSSFFNSALNYVNYFFVRAPGFFDVVCYTGNGPGTQTINHNLGVVPELVINKTRSSINGWTVFQGSTTSLTGFLRLNTNNAQGGDTLTVSSTSITADSTIGFGMNTNGTTYVTYLFASVPGVSKVGRYTGTGTTLQVNCGFTNGSRFVLIKRFDSTGDWYVWDSARGIVAGNDPYLLLNSTAAEVTNTDYVDTFSSGFEISSTAPAAINANGGTYIFLAIA